MRGLPAFVRRWGAASRAVLLGSLGGVATAAGAAGSPPSPDKPLFVFGLRQTPLGQAALAVDAEGRLIVSNIGSSGKDGVRTDLGGARGHRIVVERSFDPEESPDGAFVEMQCIVLDAAGDPLRRATHRVEDVGSILQVSGMFSESPARTIEVLFDGELVDCFPGNTGPWDLQILGAGADNTWYTELDGLIFCDDHLIVETAFRFPDGSEALGNAYRIRADDPSADDGAATVLEIRAADRPEIVIRRESLLQFGWTTHVALGQAHFDAGDEHLTISNIGSSGDDGVSIELDDLASGFGLDLEPVPLFDGARSIGLSARGVVSAEPDRSLGTASLVNPGGTTVAIRARAEFFDLGTAEVLIEVYDDGDLVGSERRAGGDVVATVEPGAEGAARLAGARQILAAPPGFAWKLDRRAVITPFDPPLSGGLVGDELRLRAADVTSVERLSRLDLEAGGFPAFTIIGEAEACQGDLTGDGVIGFGDLLVILNRWGPCMFCKDDFDDDGDIGFPDLLFVLSRWGPCPAP